jgi:hypothetical protein
LVVWRLDRLGRSTSDLIQTVTELGERGIGFQSLTEAIDPATSPGRLLFGILASLAAFSVISTRRDGDLPEVRAAGCAMNTGEGGRPAGGQAEPGRHRPAGVVAGEQAHQDREHTEAGVRGALRPA